MEYILCVLFLTYHLFENFQKKAIRKFGIQLLVTIKMRQWYQKQNTYPRIITPSPNKKKISRRTHRGRTDNQSCILSNLTLDCYIMSKSSIWSLKLLGSINLVPELNEIAKMSLKLQNVIQSSLSVNPSPLMSLVWPIWHVKCLAGRPFTVHVASMSYV